MTTLTKFAHSCFTLTINGQSLVVDPGVYTDDFAMPQQVAAVLITHAHPDHCSPALIKRIMQAFPEAEIISVHDIIVDSTTISLPEGTLSVRHAIAAMPGEPTYPAPPQPCRADQQSHLLPWRFLRFASAPHRRPRSASGRTMAQVLRGTQLLAGRRPAPRLPCS